MKVRLMYLCFLMIIPLTEGFSSPGSLRRYFGEFKNKLTIIKIESASVTPPQGGSFLKVSTRLEFNISIKAVDKYHQVSDKSYLVLNGQKYHFNKKPDIVDRNHYKSKDDLFFWVNRRKLSIDNLRKLFVNGIITVYYEIEDWNGVTQKKEKLKLSLKKGKKKIVRKSPEIYSTNYQLDIKKL